MSIHSTEWKTYWCKSLFVSVHVPVNLCMSPFRERWRERERCVERGGGGGVVEVIVPLISKTFGSSHPYPLTAFHQFWIILSFQVCLLYRNFIWTPVLFKFISFFVYIFVANKSYSITSCVKIKKQFKVYFEGYIYLEWVIITGD